MTPIKFKLSDSIFLTMSDNHTKSPEESKESEKDEENVDLLAASATTSEEAYCMQSFNITRRENFLIIR